MSFDFIHQCPRCELRFEYRGELEDHLRADHAPPVVDTLDLSAADRFDAAEVRIMAAVDPHRLASPAAEIAGRLAEQLDAGLDLVTVVPPDLPARLVDAFLDAEANRQPVVALRRTRLDGEIAPALLAHINETSPTMVVLDSHGRRPVLEILLGSVSADLVRSSPVPTLVVGPHSRLDATLDRFVVAIDGSDDARGACDIAVDLGRRLGAEVALAEVLDPDAEQPPAGVDETIEVRRLANELDPPLTDFDVLHGHNVSDELIDHVTGEEGTVLVLGTHGRSPGRHRPLGGTSARTVRRSPVPVLLVSPEAVARHRRGTAAETAGA